MLLVPNSKVFKTKYVISTWHKVFIEEYKPMGWYNSDENFNLLVRQFPALAFLPAGDIHSSSIRFDQLKIWFEDGSGIVSTCFLVCCRQYGVCVPSNPKFRRSLVSKVGYIGGLRSYRCFQNHKKLQKEQNQVELEIEVNVRGAPQHSQRKVIARERRIQTVFNNRDNMSLADFLRGIAHNIIF